MKRCKFMHLSRMSLNCQIHKREVKKIPDIIYEAKYHLPLDT